MALSSGSFNGTINGKNGQYVTYKMDWSVNSVSQTGKTANVTLHTYAKANDTRANQYNASAPTKTYYEINGTRTNVIDKRVNADFRNKGSVDFGTWTGNIPYGSAMKLTITVGSEFNMNIGTGWLDGGSVSGNIKLPDLFTASSFTIADGNIGSTAPLAITACDNSLTHSIKLVLPDNISYWINGSGNLVSTETKFSNRNVNVILSKDILYPLKPFALDNVMQNYCWYYVYTYSGNTLIGSSSKQAWIKSVRNDVNPTINYTIADTNPITTALTGNNQVRVVGYSTMKVTATATTYYKANLALFTIGDVNVNYSTTASGQNNIFNANKIFSASEKYNPKISVKDTRTFSANAVPAISEVNYIPLTCSATFKRQVQTSKEVVLNYSGNYFNNTFGAVANTLTLNWQYRQKGASTWTNGGTLTPTLNGNTYSGSISCGEIAELDKAYEFRILYSDKLVNTNTGNIVVTQSNGALEIYAKSIWVAGQKFLWWD